MSHLTTASQSPSLRGSGRFLNSAMIDDASSLNVSIPFIAGQWSLRGNSTLLETTAYSRLNPLHCGAVVASVYRHNRVHG